MNITESHSVLSRIRLDPRYKEGLLYGKPRRCHQEGTVENHIRQLEDNLERMRCFISIEQFWKLKLLIHVHDIMKYKAKRHDAVRVAICDKESHATLARKFFEEFSDDEDMGRMIQLHDEGNALWCQFERNNRYNENRMAGVREIVDLETFLIFTVLDGFTPSKDHVRIRWFIEQVGQNRNPIWRSKLNIILNAFRI